MSKLAGDKQRTASEKSAVQKKASTTLPGKRSTSSRTYNGIQLKGESNGEDVHAAADQGVSGAGGALPFGDQIQAAFGSHDVSGIRAHTDGNAQEANAAMGATAYAKGSDVAFGGAPDLHTAAHEAAHVVQQRAGVSLKDGVGQSGDAYEQHADAVADAVVRGESAESMLSAGAGGGGGSAVQAKSVQFLGTPLSEDLPKDAAKPAFGEDKHKQRRYSPEQYIEMWEKEQGRKIKPSERETNARGCIGITANNLNGGGNPPLDMAFGTFEQAHKVMEEKNAAQSWLSRLFGGTDQYVVFAKMFWSNQSPDENKRKNPDDKAFLPDPKTGKVDMSGYKYRAQPGFVNFDYAFWDEASQSFWHANHMDYGDPSNPMKVLQSTKAKFAAGYRDFDRVIYCVALAKN
jgi:hypothetical protein